MNICTPYSAGGCSAVGFYFARRVSKEMGVPIGILYQALAAQILRSGCHNPVFSEIDIK